MTEFKGKIKLINSERTTTSNATVGGVRQQELISNVITATAIAFTDTATLPRNMPQACEASIKYYLLLNLLEVSSTVVVAVLGTRVAWPQKHT